MAGAAAMQQEEFGTRRAGCISLLMRLAVLMTLLAGPGGQPIGAENGLLGEYFLTFSETCAGANGSVHILDGRVPNLTRVDGAVNFNDRLAFGIKRCNWEENNAGSLKYVCRANDEATWYFAARWTGYLYVQKEGMYTFKLSVDDGARLIIGNARCPSAMCGPWEQTINSRLTSGFSQTGLRDAYAVQCPLCESGVYGDCWVSDNGCEPFIQWHVEMDNGLNGSCNHGPRIHNASRWLPPGYHPIRIEYFQRGGEAQMSVEYKGPDADDIGANGGFVAISARSYIFPQFAGLRADWFEMPPLEQFATPLLPDIGGLGTFPGKFIRTMDDDFIAHGPGAGWFSQQLFTDAKPVLIRWSGFMTLNEPGLYTFELICDDGARLVIAGRGGERERIVVARDGPQDRAERTAVTTTMMAGIHGIRIDYFYRPGYVGAVAAPPGIELSYSGPDTGGVLRPVASTGGGTILQTSDATCQMRNWAWGQGMSISRDCKGRCADTNEAVVGDGVCDQGNLLFGNPTLDVRCPAYNNDNSDCEDRVYPVPTTPRPSVQCYENCPAGGYFRNNCRSCPSGSSLDSGKNPLCIKTTAPLCEPPPDQPDACSNLACCVAHISGLDGWGGDCMAFGTSTNCTDTLATILASIREEPMDLFSAAYYEYPLNPRPQKYAYLLKDCEDPLCNSIPTEMVVNPRTGLDTDEPVCPVGERDTGITCFEGPWDVTEVRVPRDECEGGPGNGKYQWNFCKNTKTTEGQPFVRCCTFAYQNALGKGECRFTGLPYGSCNRYIQALQESKSASQWTRISNVAVLNECDKDDCNNPIQEEEPTKGCSYVVIEWPIETADTNTHPPGYMNHTEMLQGGSETPGDGPPWLILGLISGALLGLVLALVVTNHLLKEPFSSPWYSNKAHIVADDTWIEPAQDEEGGTYGKIAPRPVAFNMLVKQEKAQEGHSFAPKALEDLGAISQHPALEATMAEERLRRAAEANERAEAQMATVKKKGNRRGSMRASRLSIAAYNTSSTSHRSSMVSSAPRGSIMDGSAFGTSVLGSSAGDGALALEDVSGESDAGTQAGDYDGIFMPHMVEVVLNQVNPASLSRPAAADRYHRGGINDKPMIQTVCT